tara:strand:- start:4538 stop:4729 length:192 start_codon:yes stop_codon:yes gene_type:complete
VKAQVEMLVEQIETLTLENKGLREVIQQLQTKNNELDGNIIELQEANATLAFSLKHPYGAYTT